MKILVIGEGGREDALCWRLSRDSKTEIFAAPGNPGTSRWAVNLNLTPLFAAERIKPDLVVIGPEVPLAEGIADALRAKGFRVFGPGKDGAKIESSKIFAKELMIKYGIPTAKAVNVRSFEEAKSAINSSYFPLVIKADGLASGKGVTVAADKNEAEEFLNSLFNNKKFGKAGENVLVEDFLSGREASVLAVTDGENFMLLPSAEDHKTLLDGDKGPNTGGMGAISPTPVLNNEILDSVKNDVFVKIIDALNKEKINYRGIIYAGLMIQNGKPFVLEFNARFGDPETQAILPRITGNLSKALYSAANGRLDAESISTAQYSSACVVISSKGYPQNPEFGDEISGINLEDKKSLPVFIAGAKLYENKLVTSGGRVLSIVGTGKTISDAINSAYDRINSIKFEGMHYRKDIGRLTKS